ncbi:MAG: amidohydrolase family protein [Sedimentisphaerales bacterium]|nr:amidohydrolase family protein [Sedimentisphaerales bacterium]
MIVDVNAYLGHFAFRRLRYNTAASLLTLMDAKRIDKAIVSSAAAITYRNAQAGNEELTQDVRGHNDRLIPFAVINPFYAGWRDDLKICHEEFGMTGLRLYPKWHNYELSSSCCRELVEAATERDMVISIPIRVEDNRQRSWLLNVPDIPLEEIVELVKKHPKARFILLNGIGYTGCPLGRKDNGLPSNYAIGLSRLSAVLRDELGQLITNLGAGRVMFGTGMPFKYPDPAFVKMDVLDASDADKEKIYSQNARDWLRL